MISLSIPIGVPSVGAYDINEKFSVGGVLAAGYHYQALDRNAGSDDEGGGAVPLQPEMSFRPTDRDEFFVKFGFASGNQLKRKTPFTINSWAADLEDDVENINGRNRDYLLTAWYKHIFPAGSHTLELSGGLIDSTDYLDENAYANDEYTQFMNEVFANGPNVFLPSYDMGGAFGWDVGRFGFRTVVMNVGENDDGNNYTFFGGQAAYTLTTGLGEGTYRLVAAGTTKEFLNRSGTSKKRRAAILLSFDQQLGELFGAFVRLGWQDDAAAVDFEAIYSGGFNISGQLWRRPQDNIGVAYAYLDGGNKNINHTHVFEFYVRIVLNDYVAFTADVQYMDEDVKDGSSPRGWIPGFRVTAEF